MSYLKNVTLLILCTFQLVHDGQLDKALKEDIRKLSNEAEMIAVYKSGVGHNRPYSQEKMRAEAQRNGPYRCESNRACKTALNEINTAFGAAYRVKDGCDSDYVGYIEIGFAGKTEVIDVSAGGLCFSFREEHFAFFDNSKDILRHLITILKN